MRPTTRPIFGVSLEDLAAVLEAAAALVVKDAAWELLTVEAEPFVEAEVVCAGTMVAT